VSLFHQNHGKTKKIRFGKRLVKKDEMILDMYTGIGYYTLPALIHGKAKHVVACEWNEHAIQALRYNVKDNHLDDRVTIYPGDCRTTAKDQHLVNMFDRVSLGLLPSSEGGWETAVCALKNETGGWLHVHGNVRNAEKETWALWLCQRLLDICQDVGKPSEWIVLGNHVERVKSFAPTVSHFVADVFVGPADGHPRSKDITTTGGTGRAGLLIGQEGCIAILEEGQAVAVPSCALSPDGVLSQSWMM
jgi:tRNA G37 N-methylase Trm5